MDKLAITRSLRTFKEQQTKEGKAPTNSNVKQKSYRIHYQQRIDFRKTRRD